MAAVFSAALPMMVSTPSIAADIRVLTSGAPAAVERALIGEFERRTGHHVTLKVGTLAAMLDKLTAEQAPDLAIFPSPVVGDLAAKGVLSSATRIDLARVGIGIAVRTGAASPDISTMDAFRDLLVRSRSIVFPDPAGGGYAGAHIARVIDELGLRDQVDTKVRHLFAIDGGLAAVANGDADIGIFNISEILPAKGVVMAGALPEAAQNYITFSGAMTPTSATPDASLAFLRWLADGDGGRAWVAGGFVPAGEAESQRRAEAVQPKASTMRSASITRVGAAEPIQP
jgi:molybdate transport system substrate-binding protein